MSVAASALRTFIVPATPAPFNGAFVFQEPKDPALADWYWVDMTALILDQTGGESTTINQVMFEVIEGDEQLGIQGSSTAINGYVCGCYLVGGTPGAYYGIRLLLQTAYSPTASLAVTVVLYVLPIGTQVINSNTKPYDWALSLSGFESLFYETGLISLTNAEIFDDNLILYESNGNTINVGTVVGQNGVSVTTASTPNGTLTLGLSNGTTLTAGYVVGPQGQTGATGGVAPISTPTNVWNASTNTPTLVSSTGTAGLTYVVSVAGTTNLDGNNSWNVGDVALFVGAGHWTRVQSAASVLVTVGNSLIPGSPAARPFFALSDGQGRVMRYFDLLTGQDYAATPNGLIRMAQITDVGAGFVSNALIPGIGQALVSFGDGQSRALFAVAASGDSYLLNNGQLSNPFQQNLSDFDVIVYGGNIGGIMAAYHYWLAGYRVCLLEPLFYWGGAQTAGLSYTDLPDGTANQNAVIGGLTYSVWFQGIVALYNHYNAYRYIFEPKVAEQNAQNIIAAMAGPAPGLSTGYVRAFLNCPISGSRDIMLAGSGANAGTNTPNGAIAGIITPQGLFTASLFHDASYTGDLLRVHGQVPWTNGRESNQTISYAVVPGYNPPTAFGYGEYLAGFNSNGAGTQTITGLAYVDFPVSQGGVGGLTNNGTPNETQGQADSLVMANNYRGCVTRTTSNLTPFSKPYGYNFLEVRGTLAIYAAQGYTTFINPTAGFVSTNLGYQAKLPNGKANFNGFDFENLTGNFNTATWPQRQQIFQTWNQYLTSLFYAIAWDSQTVATFPSLAALQTDAQLVGWCTDEFTTSPNGAGVPYSPYIRLGIAMVPAVVTQANLLLSPGSSQSIGCWQCTFDAKPAQQYAPTGTTGTVINEGFIGASQSIVYQIPATALLPPSIGGVPTCPNLIVTGCPAFSYVARTVSRLEIFYGITGEGGAEIGIDYLKYNLPNVQSFNYSRVQARLLTYGTLLNLPS